MTYKTQPSSKTVAVRELRAWLLLLVAEGSAYGWDLSHRIREFGLEPDQAAVYRALHALEEEGLVTADWEGPVSGPARRTYAVTASGRRELDHRARELAERRRTLSRFLRLHRSLGSSD